MRRGFSFTEILFAVIILGIGFIMVAAIFPVALQQAKSTTEEITASTIARGAANVLSKMLADGAAPGNPTLNTNTSNIVATGTANQPAIVAQFPVSYPAVPGVTLWDSIRGNLIRPDDPRFAWVALYRRGGDINTAGTWDPYAQVYIFPVHSRATSSFDPAIDTAFSSGTAPTSEAWQPTTTAPNLMPRAVKVGVIDSTDPSLLAYGASTDMIAISYSSPVGNWHAAVEGAYVIISDDHSTAARGHYNGLIFRLGAERTDLETAGIPLGGSAVYELQPGNDFAPDNTGGPSIGLSTPADAFIIGRSYSPGSNTDYEDAAMPIGVYTTYLKVN